MRTTMVAAVAALLTITALAGVAAADSGAGVCVMGEGISLTTTAVAGPFVGVNVGIRNSTSGVYTEQAEYEAQCCAEGDMAADCFRPVA